MQWVTQVATSNSDAGAALHRQQLAYFFLYVTIRTANAVQYGSCTVQLKIRVRVQASKLPPHQLRHNEVFVVDAVSVKTMTQAYTR